MHTPFRTFTDQELLRRLSDPPPADRDNLLAEVSQRFEKHVDTVERLAGVRTLLNDYSLDVDALRNFIESAPADFDTTANMHQVLVQREVDSLEALDRVLSLASTADDFGFNDAPALHAALTAGVAA